MVKGIVQIRWHEQLIEHIQAEVDKRWNALLDKCGEYSKDMIKKKEAS
jgi:hypothetical protein